MFYHVINEGKYLVSIGGLSGVVWSDVPLWYWSARSVPYFEQYSILYFSRDFFFIKSTISTSNLKGIKKELLTALQFVTISTRCGCYPSNSRLNELMLQSKGPEVMISCHWLVWWPYEEEQFTQLLASNHVGLNYILIIIALYLNYLLILYVPFISPTCKWHIGICMWIIG